MPPLFVSTLKDAIRFAAKRKEELVKDWIDNKKATYPNEDAFYADKFSLAGVNEGEKLDTAIKETCAIYHLSEQDASFISAILFSCWNDTLDWANTAAE